MKLPAALSGRYAPIRPLGEGAMGQVLLARDLRLDRLVALKFPRLDGVAEEEGRRFREEARALSRLRHPGIVGLLDFHEAGPRELAIVLEYVEGGSLAARLEAEAAVPTDRALTWGAQILDALEHAHRAGIVHRDLKPANVLVDADDRARVTDFGLALRSDRSRALTRAGVLLGTPYYMAPELLRGGAPSRASDLYAASCLLYELLTGGPPFRGETVADVLQAHLRGEHVPLGVRRPDLPSDAVGAVEAGLSMQPETRPPSAEALARLLDDARAGKDVSSRPTVALPRQEGTPPSRRDASAAKETCETQGRGRSRRRVAAGGLLAVVLVALLILAIRTRPREAPRLVAGTLVVVSGAPLPAGTVELRWRAEGEGVATYEILREGRSLGRGRVEGRGGVFHLRVRGLEGGRRYGVRLADGDAWRTQDFEVPRSRWLRPLVVSSLWGRVLFDGRVENVRSLRLRVRAAGGETAERKIDGGAFPVVLPEKARLRGPFDGRVTWSISQDGKELAAGELPLERSVHLACVIASPRFRPTKASDAAGRGRPVVVGHRSVVVSRWGVVQAYERRSFLDGLPSPCALRLAFALPVLTGWSAGDGGGRIEGLTALPGDRLFFSQELDEGAIFHLVAVGDRAARWPRWESEPARDRRDLEERRQRSVLRDELFDPRQDWWAKASPGEGRWTVRDLAGLRPQGPGRAVGADLVLLPLAADGRSFGLALYDLAARRPRWLGTVSRELVEAAPCLGRDGEPDPNPVAGDDADENWSAVGAPLVVGPWIYQQLRIDRTRADTSHEGALLAYPREGGPGRVLLRHLRNDEEPGMAPAANGRGVWVVTPFGAIRVDAARPEHGDFFPADELVGAEGGCLQGALLTRDGTLAFSSWRGVGTRAERNFGNAVFGGRFAMRLFLLSQEGGRVRIASWTDPVGVDFGMQRMALGQLDEEGDMLWGATPHEIFAVNRRSGACGVMDCTDVSSALQGAVRVDEGEIHVFDRDGRASLVSLPLLVASGADRPPQLLPASHRLGAPETNEGALRRVPLTAGARRWSPR